MKQQTQNECIPEREWQNLRLVYAFQDTILFQDRKGKLFSVERNLLNRMAYLQEL